MASKSKSKEKKNAKKDRPVIIEEPPAPPEEKNEDVKDENLEEKPEEDINIEQEPPKEPTPSPEVEEPSLCELIVECFEGEVMRGLFEGDGSAYFYGGHVYQGQFFQGLMHGHGVYTWADGVKYEGDFHENCVTGKGMYTWPDGSSYEGDVLNGKRHGHGTFRSMSSPSSYTGNWVHGKREGAGIIRYDTDGMSFYEGDWVDNKRHGFGVRRYRSGNVYEGEWVDNQRHGTGVMRWVDVDQSYNGEWYHGVQHGQGDHSWFLKRLPGSQYPLRNQYVGQFVYGKRHGYGNFYFANGARYEGEWENNMKNGRGVFTFKNGRLFEGVFHDDRMVEYPDFAMDGTSTPDITGIRTRTPDPLGPAHIGDNGTARSFESRNTLGPSLTLDIEHLLNQFDDSDREEELQQVMFVTLRHITHLRKVYSFYSSLGHDTAVDNTFIMTRLQFWRFLKDCQFHRSGLTLMEMDRILANDKNTTDIHSPLDKLLLREFLNHVITLSYHMNEEEHSGKGTVVSWCFSKVITDNIFPFACDVQGRFLCEPRYSVNALGYLERTMELYYAVCTPRKASPYELSLKMREFLFMLKDYKLINDRLSPKMIIQILAYDDPAAYDSVDYNLELEMTFLEFFEALIGCAMIFVTEEIVKDPTTPRPSTTISNAAQSSYGTSTPATASRASQLEDNDEQGMTGGTSPHHSSISPPTSPALRVASSTEELTQKGSSEKQGSFALSPRTEAGQESGLDIKQSKSDVGTEAKMNSTHSIATARSGGADEMQPLLQSMLSMGEANETAEDDVIEEEMDDETREFNFWTHQINIFFLRKLFPAYEHMEKVKEKKEAMNAEERALAEQSLLLKERQTKEEPSKDKHLAFETSVTAISSVEMKREGSITISQVPTESKH